MILFISKNLFNVQSNFCYVIFNGVYGDIAFKKKI
jgi:hypothetical protein